jgi:hypothetical protein
VPQHQRGSSARVELIERLAQPGGQLVALELLLGLRHPMFRGPAEVAGPGPERFERLGAAAGSGPLAHQRPGHGDPVEPGGEACLAAERLHRAVSLDHRLLRDLVGVTPVAQHPQGHPEDPLAVVTDQGREGTPAAPLRPPHEQRLGFGV